MTTKSVCTSSHHVLHCRLAFVDENGMQSRNGIACLRPIHPGDAAAVAQGLARSDEWVRVDAKGHAELIKVPHMQPEPGIAMR